MSAEELAKLWALARDNRHRTQFPAITKSEELAKLRALARDNRKCTQFPAITRLWRLTPEERSDYVPALLDIANNDRSYTATERMFARSLLWAEGGRMRDAVRPVMVEAANEVGVTTERVESRVSAIHSLRESDNPEDTRVAQEIIERLEQSHEPGDKGVLQRLQRRR